MVNVARLKKKIPALLCDGDTSRKPFKPKVMRDHYRLQQFLKRNPDQANTLLNELIRVLGEIELELKKNCKGGIKEK